MIQIRPRKAGFRGRSHIILQKKGFASYHSSSHFICCYENSKINSRNTALTLQSNLQGMCSCEYVTDHSSTLPDEAALCCDKSEPGSTFLPDNLTVLCWSPLCQNPC